MKDPTWFRLEAAVNFITEKAIKFTVEDDDIWLPFSQIGSALSSTGEVLATQLQKGDVIEAIEAAEWIGREKNLAKRD